MSKKTDTPLVVLNALAKYKNLKGKEFVPVDKEEDLFRFSGIGENEVFYYHIKNYHFRSGKHYADIVYKPYSQTTLQERVVAVPINDIKSSFDHWLNHLKQYEAATDIYDDPIVQSYQKDYFTDFKIIEDDDNNYLHPKQLLMLDQYLENFEQKLSEYSEDDENIVEIKAIHKEVQSVRKNIASKTKLWLADKTALVLAKITKLGPKYIGKFTDDLRKEMAGDVAKRIFNFSVNIIENM